MTLDDTRPGDILRAKSGLLRVARAVHGSKKGGRKYIFFTIKHCSWTKRCYTLYTVKELEYMGYTHTGKRWRWMPGERDLNNSIGSHSRKFTCCDVEGID